MNRLFPLLVGLVVALLPRPTFATEPPTVAPAKPRDGVFIRANIFSSTVIELKEGRFRYWFESDVKVPSEPAYPLSGKYVLNGDTITLQHDRVFERQWTFRTLNGALTLWRPEAIKFFAEQQRLDGYGILKRTGRSAEEAWKHRLDPPAKN